MKKKFYLLRNKEIPEIKKLFRFMKLTSLFILFSVVSVFANNTYSQNKTVNLNMNETTIKKVLSRIEDQSNFIFMFSNDVVDVNKKVAIKVHGLKIESVLNKLFDGTGIQYTRNGRIIVLSGAKENYSISALQKHSISGKVVDIDKQPLPGVTVVIKGTAMGTITDADGNYSLSKVQDSVTLVF